ncbi:hypothetical protein A3770_17p78930 [Chloropicon primus]|uniref:Sulfotransferase domain-containing protein n=1 Tax=Chloropicon primus TaxID=1764295 RepID=A0A5B8N0F2_9CHLO|nr:hypothetical protein A3770_17p78930 [Chloropicon primus]|eukprot:QDZ25375.1 hypothetical protein A3770_17p78930 [Chloropicon primus]
MARITPRKECILVLTNLLMKTEEQLNDNIATLESDMRALSQWNPCSKWKVNFVVRTNLKLAFAEKLRGLMKRGDLEPFVRYTGSSARFNKFVFIKPLVQQMGDYDYVLLKDADQRIAGFPWNTFMEKKGESVISGPLRETVGESLLKGMARKNLGQQWYQLHDARSWKKPENAEDFELIKPRAAEFIEQYFALLEGRFAVWFFEVALTDEFLDQRLDWGPDLTWCGAAADTRPDKPACSLVPVVSEHLDTREIEKDSTEGKKIDCPCPTCPCQAADLPKQQSRGLALNMIGLLHYFYHDGSLFERWMLASEEYRNNFAHYGFGTEQYKKNVARFSNKTKTHHTLDASPERKNLSKARLPDLLLIGVQKGGSTAVTEWLFEEGVCGATPFQDGVFSGPKELHFFDEDERFRLGKSEYLQHFKHCVGKKTRFTMDATPDSFWYPEHVYEVYKDDPDLDRLKIIVLLREPIARELSLYNHMRNLWSKDPDPKAWYRRVSTESFPEFAKKKLRDGADYKSYYAQYLSRWFQFFDPQQILVLSYEHEVLPGTPAKQRIGDFLGHSFRDDKGAFPRVQVNPTAKEELMHAYKRVLDSKVLVSMMDGSRLVGSAESEW